MDMLNENERLFNTLTENSRNARQLYIIIQFSQFLMTKSEQNDFVRISQQLDFILINQVNKFFLCNFS